MALFESQIGNFVKTAVCVFIGTCWDRWNFFIYIGFWVSKNFWFFVKKVSARLSELNSTCTFRKIVFMENIHFRNFFSHIERNNFDVLANYVHSVGETACDASLAINWRIIIFFSKKMNFFSIFSCGEKFQLFVDTTSAELSKMHLLHTKDTLRKKLFLNSTCSWEHFKPLFFYWKSFHFFFGVRKNFDLSSKMFSVGLPNLVAS